MRYKNIRSLMVLLIFLGKSVKIAAVPLKDLKNYEEWS